jgi:hypothetical protein
MWIKTDLSSSNYLAHHGVKGQKWGVKNGPPYPLKPGQHSAAEKKAGWQKSVSGGLGDTIKKKASEAAPVLAKGAKVASNTLSKGVKKGAETLSKGVNKGSDAASNWVSSKTKAGGWLANRKAKKQAKKEAKAAEQAKRDHDYDIWSEAFDAGEKWAETGEGKKLSDKFSSLYDQAEASHWQDDSLNDSLAKAEEAMLRGQQKAEANYIRKQYGDEEFIRYVNDSHYDQATTVSEAMHIYEEDWQLHAM